MVNDSLIGVERYGLRGSLVVKRAECTIGMDGFKILIGPA
jgi:hypothetical protein